MTNFEEKMAGNLKDKNAAFQSAEAALMAAELNIENKTRKVFIFIKVFIIFQYHT